MQTRRFVAFVVVAFLAVLVGVGVAGPGTGMGGGM